MSNRYWCQRRLLITTTGPDGSECRTINRPYARVGAHEDAEVRVTGTGVPPVALYLHATDQGIFCVGLDPNGPPLRRWLGADETVAVGDYTVAARFADDRPQTRPVKTPDERGTAGEQFPVLSVELKGQRIAKCRQRRQLTIIGRMHPSTFRIKSEYISATHCMLYWQDGRLWALDLLSSNGTNKQGKRVNLTRLRLGQVLNLGKIRVRFSRVGRAESVEPLPYAGEESVGASSHSSPSGNDAVGRDTPTSRLLDAVEHEVEPSSEVAAAVSERAETVPSLDEEGAESSSSHGSNGSSGNGSSANGSPHGSGHERQAEPESESPADEPEAVPGPTPHTGRRVALQPRRFEWQQERAELEREFAERARKLHEEVTRSEEQLEAQRQREQELADQLQQLAQGQAEMEEQRARATRVLEERIAELQDQAQALRRQHDTLESQRDDWDEERSRLTEESRALEERKAELESWLEEREQRRRQDEEQMQRLQLELESNRSELSSEKHRWKEETERQSVVLEQQIEALRSAQRELADEQEELRRRRVEVEAELAEQSERQRQRHDELDAGLRTLAEQQDLLKQQRDAWEEARFRDEQELNDQRNRLLEEQQALADMRHEMETLRESWFAEQQRQQDRLEVLLSQLDREIAHDAGTQEPPRSDAHADEADREGVPEGPAHGTAGREPADAETARDGREHEGREHEGREEIAAETPIPDAPQDAPPGTPGEPDVAAATQHDHEEDVESTPPLPETPQRDSDAEFIGVHPEAFQLGPPKSADDPGSSAEAVIDADDYRQRESDSSEVSEASGRTTQGTLEDPPPVVVVPEDATPRGPADEEAIDDPSIEDPSTEDSSEMNAGGDRRASPGDEAFADEQADDNASDDNAYDDNAYDDNAYDDDAYDDAYDDHDHLDDEAEDPRDLAVPQAGLNVPHGGDRDPAYEQFLHRLAAIDEKKSWRRAAWLAGIGLAAAICVGAIFMLVRWLGPWF